MFEIAAIGGVLWLLLRNKGNTTAIDANTQNQSYNNPASVVDEVIKPKVSQCNQLKYQ